MWPGNYFNTLFQFQGMLCKKESEEVCVLIWTNFDSFAKIYRIQKACCGKLILQQRCALFLTNTKGPGSSFQSNFQISYPEQFFKNSFFCLPLIVERCAGDEVVFRWLFLQNFLIKFFLLQNDINWQNFINIMCLLPKLFSRKLTLT